ncbi:MAG: hypothetical protein D6706_16150 [Chloroflexi bacterium]|nr:MAG: hypothetical protein D6706_16150 [Chloroflexota bacterium]
MIIENYLKTFGKQPEKTKAAGSTPNFVQGHGPGGTFSLPGLDQFVFSALLWPHLGLARRLPFRLSNDTNPLYGIITGATATSGNNPVNECDDPPVAGEVKMGTISLPFGRLSLQTKTVNIEHIGERINRSEFFDLNLIGGMDVAGNAAIPSLPTGRGNIRRVMQNEAEKAIVELAIGWATRFSKLCYTGNPTNNTAGGGYKEFYGLESLVNTGYQDAQTGVAMPAADSIVHTLAGDVTDPNVDIVGVIQDIVFRLLHISTQSGLGVPRLVFAMPRSLYYRLTEVWAYYYWSRAANDLTFANNVRINLGAEGITNLRDTMRAGIQEGNGTLFVDGIPFDVIIDDAIPQTNLGNGQFSSDIYILPLAVQNGAVPSLYMEFFNFASPNGTLEAAQLLGGRDAYMVTDNGAYLWHKKPPTNLCTEVAAWSRPRLVLRTPYLAARITDVRWKPVTEHERSPYPGDDYFVDGGSSDRSGYGPSYYPPTA